MREVCVYGLFKDTVSYLKQCSYEWLDYNELESMLKEASTARDKALSQDMPGGTGKNQEQPQST